MWLKLEWLVFVIFDRASDRVNLIVMKKRTESDFIKQKNSSRKTLNNARYSRSFDKYKWFGTPRKVFSRVVIFAPESLSLFGDNYDKFSRFLGDIERQAGNGRMLIDLSNVRTIKVSALLVLYANIEQLQKKYKDSSIIKTCGAVSSDVSKFFRTFGIWGLTGESRIRPQKKFSESLEICTMPHKDLAPSDYTRQLRKVVRYAQEAVKKVGMHEGALLAYNAITESVSNVWQHAYDDAFFDVPVHVDLRNWWI